MNEDSSKRIKNSKGDTTSERFAAKTSATERDRARERTQEVCLSSATSRILWLFHVRGSRHRAPRRLPSGVSVREQDVRECTQLVIPLLLQPRQGRAFNTGLLVHTHTRTQGHTSAARLYYNVARAESSQQEKGKRRESHAGDNERPTSAYGRLYL